MQLNSVLALLSAMAAAVMLMCLFFVYFYSSAYSIKGINAFVALLFSFVFGNVFYAFQFMASTPAEALLYFKIQMANALLTLAFYIMLFRANMPKVRRYTKAQIIILSFCLIFGFSALLFNPFNMCYGASKMEVMANGLNNLIIEFNVGFIIIMAVVYIVAAFYVINFLRLVIAGKIKKGNAIALFASVLFVVGANGLYVMGITNIDYTNIIVFIPAILLSYAVINFGVMDTVSYIKRNMFKLFHAPFLVVLPDGEVEFANPSALEILGRTQHQVERKQITELIKLSDTQLEAVDTEFEAELVSPSSVSVRLNSAKLVGPKSKSFGKIMFMHNITAEKAAKTRLSYLQKFDDITGLMNSASFLDAIERFHDTSEEGLVNNFIFAITLGNADRLRGIASDEQRDIITLQAADYIRKILPAQYLLSHYSDNEFYIFSNGCDTDTTQLLDTFERMRHTMFVIREQTFSVEFRLAMYGITDANVTAKEAISKTSFALNSVLMGDKAVEIYDNKMTQQHDLHRKLLTSLSEINFDRDFYLEFQPIVDIKNNRIASAEALLRWRHPIYGQLSPAVFIPIFESANEMNTLGREIIIKACEAIKNMAEFLDPGFRLSVNISKRQIDNYGFTEELGALLKEMEVDPTMLDFEITETATSGRIENVIDFARFVKDMGATISLDDFGSGDTSIAYITELGVDKVKLDISLSDNSHINFQRGIVVKALLDMCENLDIAVVVEHVESIDALASLHEQGFSLIQGYIFSRPLAYDQFRDYYKNFSIIGTLTMEYADQLKKKD